MTRHRLAPVAAIALGFPVAVGVAAVHLLPRWSDFSDAFPGSTTGVNAMSWTVVLIEIAGAFALGLAGLAMLRRSREPARSA
jgi:MYXO-CTERM domain-containing protein